MDKNLVVYFCAVIIVAVILLIGFRINNNNEAIISKAALENGYCSKVSPTNNSKIVWNKCEKAPVK